MFLLSECPVATFATISARGQPRGMSALAAFIRWIIAFSCQGSIRYIIMEWRHLTEFLAAALPVYAKCEKHLVWKKSKAGHGGKAPACVLLPFDEP